MDTDERDRFDLLRALRDLAEALESAGLDYMVTGGAAVGWHGEARSTKDLDVIVKVGLKEAPKLIVALGKNFEVQPEMAESEIARGGMFKVFHKESVFKVDVVVKRDDPLSNEQFARREVARGAGHQFWIISAEDLVLAKLLWARDSYSERQLRDIKALIEANPDLDRLRIERWVSRLRLDALWAEVNE